MGFSSELKFQPHTKIQAESTMRLSNTVLKFNEGIDVAGEKIFYDKFQRKASYYDSGIVSLQDVKNLVLFLLSSKLPDKILTFIHDDLFDKFLHSVIFYFDMYLMVLEFLLIRRDQELDGRGRDTHSLKVEQFLSKQLSDRRILIAREYSKVRKLKKL